MAGSAIPPYRLSSSGQSDHRQFLSPRGGGPLYLQPSRMDQPNGKTTPSTSGPDLEIKDAQVIFKPIWEDLEAHFGREHLRFPKEIILLGGAPGAGKGTQ